MSESFKLWLTEAFAELLKWFPTASVAAFIIHMLRKYMWSDAEFVLILVTIVAIDTITGTLAAIRTKTFSSKGMGKLLDKVIALGIGLFSLHVAAVYFTGALGDVLGVADRLLYAYVVLREVVSVHENCAKIGYPLLPPSAVKRVRDWWEK